MADLSCVWLFVLKVKVSGLGFNLRPIGCTPALSVTQSAAVVCGLWHYTCICNGPFTFYGNSKDFSDAS